jgi:hypothetical protein
MKKLLTICLIMVSVFTLNAQDEKYEIQTEIIKILNNAPKVYTDDGNMYQNIVSFKFLSDEVLEFYMHQYPVRQGEKEYDQKRGYTKITIDFSKIQIVLPRLKLTNYGYMGILLSSTYAGEGGKYIGVQRTEPDNYGIHTSSRLSDIRWESQIIIPIDNTELITLLKEYIKIFAN